MSFKYTLRNLVIGSALVTSLPALAQSDDDKAEKKKPAKAVTAPLVRVPVQLMPVPRRNTPGTTARPPVIGAPLPQGQGGSSSHVKKPVTHAPVIGAPLPQGQGGSSSFDKKPAGGAPVIGAPGPASTSAPSFANKPAAPTVSSSGRATYTLSNGQQVPRNGPDGRAGIPDDKGGVGYKDGTYITADEDGNTVVSHGGKVQSVTAPPGSGTGSAIPSHSSTGTPTYTLSNGQQVPRFGQDGMGVGIADNKGGVSYPDGTYVMVNEKGDTVVSRNGEVVSVTPAPDSNSSSDSDSDSDDNSSSDSDSDDDSSESSSDDDSDDSSDDSDDTSSDDDADADDADGDDGESADKYGLGTGGFNRGPGQLVQDIVNRRMGIGREPESAGPKDCEDKGAGGNVMDPWAGPEGQESCIPAGTPRPSTEGSGSGDTSGSIWQAPTKGAIRDAVTQPGLADHSFGRDDGKAPMEVLQLFEDSVTNPRPD